MTAPLPLPVPSNTMAKSIRRVRNPNGAQAAVDQEGEEGMDRSYQFVKTKMCKFELIGMCTKGNQCPFAHDRVEMKPLPDLTCTKLCKELIQTGECSDPQCSYAHTKEELRATSTFHKTKLCRFQQLGHCALGLKCNFAHSEDEIRKNEQAAQAVQVPEMQQLLMLQQREQRMLQSQHQHQKQTLELSLHQHLWALEQQQFFAQEVLSQYLPAPRQPASGDTNGHEKRSAGRGRGLGPMAPSAAEVPAASLGQDMLAATGVGVPRRRGGKKKKERQAPGASMPPELGVANLGSASGSTLPAQAEGGTEAVNASGPAPTTYVLQSVAAAAGVDTGQKDASPRQRASSPGSLAAGANSGAGLPGFQDWRGNAARQGAAATDDGLGGLKDYEDGPAYVTVKNAFLENLGSIGGPLKASRSVGGWLDRLGGESCADSQELPRERGKRTLGLGGFSSSPDLSIYSQASGSAASAAAQAVVAAAALARGGGSAAEQGRAASPEFGRPASPVIDSSRQALSLEALRAENEKLRRQNAALRSGQPLANLGQAAQATNLGQAAQAGYTRSGTTAGQALDEGRLINGWDQQSLLKGSFTIDQKNDVWQVKNTFLTFSPQTKPMRSVRTAEGALCTHAPGSDDELG